MTQRTPRPVTVRLVLGDQLTRTLSALSDIDRETDIVVMAEVAEETTYVPHHKQKIVLVLSAMRHFAEALRSEGIRVDYTRLDAAAAAKTLEEALLNAVATHRPDRIVVTEPGEWRLFDIMRGWSRKTGLPVEIRPDTRFLASREQFADWARDRKTLRMEYFYREMRRRTGLLMDGPEPAGGRWNFDADNRKPFKPGLAVPDRLRFEPDPITRAVIELVETTFPGHIGSVAGFGWPTTREEALAALDAFESESLSRFGDYQDAMSGDEPYLFHALLAPALNLGLLTPLEVCGRAERAYRDGRVAINAAEGFIRQILGWREFVRGLYWLKMPGYAKTNALDARRPLPGFYWTGDTAMRCLATAIGQTIDNAYSHHIQRLMVTGNFALLAGIDPGQVEAWYLAVYADAYEWVELPNTHGMALFADGGLLASKPYAASGAYINRMSDFCAGCAYDVKAKSGPTACPFNYLYWAFLMRNEAVLRDNPRLRMPYRTLRGWSEEKRRETARDATAFLDTLDV